uniref:Uncharacterized protein n=1 Tax=Megaselia scalaris TaxID=36166 RepID=T1GIY2_MEGSC
MELNYDGEDSAFQKDDIVVECNNNNNNNSNELEAEEQEKVSTKQYLPDKSYFDALLELEDLSCDLETYLKKYETTADVKLEAMEKEYETYDSHLSDCCSDEMSEKSCEGLATPDILIKSKEPSSCTPTSKAIHTTQSWKNNFYKMRVLEPSGLYSACIQPTPPSPVENSVANRNYTPYNSLRATLNSIFTESGSTGNRNLLNSNELHLLNSLSNKTNCNGNFSIQDDDRVESNENLKVEYNNQFNEYFFQSEDEEYNLDLTYDKDDDNFEEDAEEDDGNVEQVSVNEDEDEDDSIVKRPISSCSTNSNSTKSINESLMEDDGKYLCAYFEPSTKNKPDLLQNVENAMVNGNGNGNEKVAKKNPLKQEIQFNDGELKSMSDFCRDDISLGVTPVDIVGDFGREVEREFGLLVSGYKMISNADQDGENIPCDLVLAATSKLKSKKENQIPETHKNKQISVDESVRYQKCSFDERQLPPVGIHYEIENIEKKSEQLEQQKHLTNLKKEKILSLVKNKKLSVPPPPPPRKYKRTNYSERSTQILGAVNQRSTDTFRFEYVQSPPDRPEDWIDPLSIDKDKYYEKRNKFLEMNNNGSDSFCSSDSLNNNNNNSKYVAAGNPESSSSFDVYNIETALPVIDMEAIEAHLQKAKEEEKKVS